MDDLVRDAEASVTGRMVDGTIEHPRLRATLGEIDAGAYAAQIALVRRGLTAAPDLPLRDALLVALIRIVKEAGVPVAMMQIVAMAFYRSTWQLLRRIDPAITLDGIRAIGTWRALSMMDGFAFGRHGRMPVDDAALRGCVDRLRRTLLPSQAGVAWAGPPPSQGPLIVAPDPSEGPATTAVRNGFFRSFFADYLLGGGADRNHDLVIDVLEEALARPERLPFLRGADEQQRAYRIAQLARTLVVLHDIGCRLSVHRERIPAEFATAPVTVQAAALAKVGVGATAGFDHLLVECLYAEFGTLVDWVREVGPRLRIPRVVSAQAPAPAPVAARPQARPAIRPAAVSNAPQARPAIGPAVGISPFSWEVEPETSHRPAAAPRQPPGAALTPKQAQKPAQQPPVRPQEIDPDKADTEVVNEEL